MDGEQQQAARMVRPGEAQLACQPSTLASRYIYDYLLVIVVYVLLCSHYNKNKLLLCRSVCCLSRSCSLRKGAYCICRKYSSQQPAGPCCCSQLLLHSIEFVLCISVVVPMALRCCQVTLASSEGTHFVVSEAVARCVETTRLTVSYALLLHAVSGPT